MRYEYVLPIFNLQKFLFVNTRWEKAIFLYFCCKQKLCCLFQHLNFQFPGEATRPLKKLHFSAKHDFLNVFLFLEHFGSLLDPFRIQLTSI
jgi:hypothetical protein